VKRVLSPSLGSPKGDYDITRTFLGEDVRIQRIGTDSDVAKFVELIDSEDGKVDCFGFGGGDVWVVAGGKRYTWRREAKMAAHARKSPLVDGSGLKNTIERETIGYLAREGIVDFAKSKTLVVSAVDRFGIAEAVAEQGGQFIFGDIIFGLGLPIPIRSARGLRVIAAIVLPIITQLPQPWFYPTGKKQEEIVPKFPRYYEWADVICGDFQYIRRHLAPKLDGKVIITNTTKPGDLELLRERGVRLLVTSTPDITLEGRTPGTNVLEALIVALSGKRPAEMSVDDYMRVLGQMEWRPRIVEVQR